MKYENFKFDPNPDCLIIRSVSTYSATAGGYWKKKPDSVETTAISAEQYTNHITAIPFFNRFGDGASARGYCSYTWAGYLPTRATTIDPGRSKKLVAEFTIIKADKIRQVAGFRERYILDRLDGFRLYHDGGHRLAEFSAPDITDNNRRASCVWSFTANAFVG